MAVKAISGKTGSGFPSRIASRPRVRLAGFFSAIVVSAVVLFATFPVSAQTNDPNLTEQDLECLRKQADGGPECVPGQAEEVQPAPGQTTEESAAEPTEEGTAQPDEFTVQGAPREPEPDADVTPDDP